EWIVRFPSIYRLRISWIPIGIVVAVLNFHGVNEPGVHDREYTSCHRVYRRHLGLHEVKGGARVAFEDEFGAAKEREVLCEAQQGRSRVKRKLFGSFRKKIGNEPILALPKGSNNSVAMREARVKMRAYTKREGDCLHDATTRDSCGERHDSRYELRRGGNVWTLIMEEAHATKYHVHPEAEIRESKMIGLEMEQDMTKVVMIKERLKEAKDRVVRFGKKCELAPRRDVIVKVSGNSKSNYELAWVWEDLMKDKYPRLFVLVMI
nr:hypothetical protein [Tanacetum cinerariifolium]